MKTVPGNVKDLDSVSLTGLPCARAPNAQMRWIKGVAERANGLRLRTME